MAGLRGTPGLTFQPDLRAAVRLAYDVRLSMQGPVRDALKHAHEVMAGEVRERSADELQRRKSSRPQRREKLMERALQDRRNSDVTHDGFTVGIQSWMDRSPARLYWRRIEQGGPNPMARFGRITAKFHYPGGPHRPDPGQAGAHGRMFWGQVQRGGFTVAPNDVASRGYHAIEAAGVWFSNSSLPLTAYGNAFRARGINFVQLYRLGYGSAPTNQRLVG